MAGSNDPDRRTGNGGSVEHQQLESVYRTEAPRLTRFLRRRLAGAEDPRDLLHDAFVRLAGSGRGTSLRNPEAYLQRILHNLLIDRSRQRARRAPHVPIEQIEIPVAPCQTEELEAEDMRRQYRGAVDALPPRTRQVFLLSRVEEVGYSEIAKRLGISVRTVEWHVAQAVLKIGETLTRE